MPHKLASAIKNVDVVSPNRRNLIVGGHYLVYRDHGPAREHHPVAAYIQTDTLYRSSGDT